MVVADPTLNIWRDAFANEALFQRARDLVNTTQSMRFEMATIMKGGKIMLPKTLHDSSMTSMFLPHTLAQKNCPSLDTTKFIEILGSPYRNLIH